MTNEIMNLNEIALYQAEQTMIEEFIKHRISYVYVTCALVTACFVF